MRKWMGCILAALLGISLLGACNCKEAEATTEETVVVTTEEAMTETQERAVTEQNVLQMFAQFTEGKYPEVIDCAVITDRAYGAVGVVQYIDQEKGGFQFAFLDEESLFNGRVGKSEGTAIKGTLEYVGDGMLAYAFQTKDGELIRESLYFEFDGSNSNYKIVTE